MDSEKFMLSVADYILFAVLLIASAAIGIYFQITSKKKTNDEYLRAGKDMSILPVAFSLMASFLSVTTLMGIPAEMYLYGTNMAFMSLGFMLGPIITAYLFLPIYFANDSSTAYEYLEKRFGKMTRKVTSGMFAIQTLLFTAASLYAPALALSAVTSLPMWLSVISVGFVCTFRCALGGMKAVLWADVFQAALMFICLFAVIVQGCLLMGGIGNIFEIANEGGRLIVPKFSFDLSAHYTIINVFAQGMIITMSLYGGGQCQIQRLMALRNLKRSKLVNLISIPMVVIFQLLCCLCGLVLYAYFRNCDPMTSPKRPIYSADQMMPYFISTSLGHLPGIPGLCICGIFSGSLSVVSSAINGLTSVTTEDFIIPLFPKLNITVFHTKFMSVVFGIICTALSFIISYLGNLIRMSVIICGNFAGPNLAVFLLAALTTTANERGVILGIVTSLVLVFCLTFVPESKPNPFLPLSNECPSSESLPQNASIFSTFSIVQNSTYLNMKPASLNETTADVGNPFQISYMWVSSIALITCLVIGYFGSFFISLFKEKSENVPDIYLSPLRVRLSQWNFKHKSAAEKKADKISTEGTRL